ncbi:hypothetical protein SPRG_03434 [Saprolegnia parasitica CBS 223.65]|uniref:Uncharacterized protein n=1 Tax=Saprolegnia parasitica (strain CBS 223.65) TaxID=695850 RepID=A0A067CP18_SAPPC|nr:hypothetical protein SPRG_03434 [Saprolegnia parasitica CBS 223.65]KDO32218.1 hypothetical protein SPRG_03434 [Saprolegnia parasitica CBS 223.65]|eukprot:XP_012197395.1 hypothetical protein SPRG_03434 [Saprolegnia parasitica CBS 223.65]
MAIPRCTSSRATTTTSTTTQRCSRTRQRPQTSCGTRACLLPFLELLKQNPLHIRWAGFVYWKLLFGDDSIKFTINRRTLLQCYATHAYPPVAIEAMFESFLSAPLPASATHAPADTTTLHLREVVTNASLTDTECLRAATVLPRFQDHKYLVDVVAQDGALRDQYRRLVGTKETAPLLNDHLRTHLMYLLVSVAPGVVHSFSAGELVLHPLALYMPSSLVVVSWLKSILDRVTHLVDIHVPPHAVVFPFDPDVPATRRRDSTMDDTAFWKCREELDGERDLCESLLNIWQRCASQLTFDLDATFGRTEQPRASLTTTPSQRPSLIMSNSKPKRGSFAPLLIVLRSMYQVLCDDEAQDDADDESSSSDDDDASRAPARRRSRLNSMPLPMDAVFLAKLNKLDYFVQVLKLPQFVATKEDTSLVHWFVLELARLMHHTQSLCATEPRWMESARRRAELITRCLQVTLASTDELRHMLQHEDFVWTETEVYRRDLFYHEHLETLRDSQLKKRAAFQSAVQNETDQARSAKQIVFLRVRPLSDPVWRKQAKEYDDWMNLERLLRWNIQHEWQLDAFTSSK